MMKTRSVGGVLLCLALGLTILWLIFARMPEAAAQGTTKTQPAGLTIFQPPYDVDALSMNSTNLWAGGKDGVMVIDLINGKGFEPVPCGGKLEYVKAVWVDEDGTLWIGHDKGLSRKDKNGCVTLTDKDGLPDIRVNSLLRDRSGRLLVGTWGGVAVLANGTWTVINSKDGLLVDMVNAIMEDDQGGLWFGSMVAPSGGISILYKGTWQYITREQGLPHPNIQALVQDRQGAVWAASGLLDRGGTARLTRKSDQWSIDQVFDSQSGMAGNKGRSLLVDRTGRLWVGSEYDGLARQTEGGWKIMTTADGLSHNEIKVMKQDVFGNLWIGTRDGVTRIDHQVLSQ